MEIRLFPKPPSPEQFEELAAREEKRVYAACYHMMGSREDALDCAQETMLRDLQGRSYDEIAAILELPLGTVKSRVSRAREKLAAILRKSSELFSASPV